MALNENNLRSDISKLYITTIKSNLTTNGVKVTNKFVDDVSELPQVVVHTPRVGRRPKTAGLSNRSGTVDIEVFAKTHKQLNELLDEVEALLDANISEQYMYDIDFGESSDTSFNVGDTLIHSAFIPVIFKLVM